MSEESRKESVLDSLIHSDLTDADFNAVYEMYCKLDDVWHFLRSFPDFDFSLEVRDIAPVLDKIDGGERVRE